MRLTTGTLNSVVWVFSVAIVFLGLAAAVGGKWLEDVGPAPRRVRRGVLSGVVGFVVGSAGIISSPAVAGLLGLRSDGRLRTRSGVRFPGIYADPLVPRSTRDGDWHGDNGFRRRRDHRAHPLKEYLIRFFYESPQYLGTIEAVSLITERGRRFAEVAGQMFEVVVVGPEDVFNMIVPENEGVYVVGTGGTGVAETFLVLGIVYFLIMIAAAFSFRVPAQGWRPRWIQRERKR